jgi:hypothetical protein
VTLLLVKVEGSTQLWESRPEAMTPAIAHLDRTASKLIAEGWPGFNSPRLDSAAEVAAAQISESLSAAHSTELGKQNIAKVRHSNSCNT